jgi:hypothetical protein
LRIRFTHHEALEDRRRAVADLSHNRILDHLVRAAVVQRVRASMKWSVGELES